MAIINFFGYDFDTTLTEENVYVEIEESSHLEYCSVMNTSTYLGVPSMHHFEHGKLSDMLQAHADDLKPGYFIFEGVSVEGTNFEDPDDGPNATLYFKTLRPATEEEIVEWS